MMELGSHSENSGNVQSGNRDESPESSYTVVGEAVKDPGREVLVWPLLAPALVKPIEE